MLLRKIYSFKKTTAFIFMFHKLENNNEQNNDNYTCSLVFFDNFLKKLKKLDYKIISMDSAIKNIEKYRFEKYVVLTFDDVSDSFYYLAYPILKKGSIPFTLFITLDFIDKPGYLSREQLIELASDELCTLGSHTVSHPLLRKSKDAFNEIYLSKVNLEKIVKREVKYFAYPYGSLYAVKKENIKQVIKSGFSYAFSTVNANLNSISTSNKYFLPRINVGSSFEKSYDNFFRGIL
jgi:peptidoglycan/xylan/chitin deacetylase (PgdA/CDA1 family)